MTKETKEQYLKRIDELCKEDNAITDKIDREETKKETIQGLKTFNADLIYDTIARYATTYENMAVRWYKYEVEQINIGGDGKLWNESAKDADKFAKDLREMMTHLVRMQKEIKRGEKLEAESIEICKKLKKS